MTTFLFFYLLPAATLALVSTAVARHVMVRTLSRLAARRAERGPPLDAPAVRGVLRVEGEGCAAPRARGEGVCAAVSTFRTDGRLEANEAEGTAHHRARDVTVQTKDGTVRLEGGLDVRAGSTLRLFHGWRSDEGLTRLREEAVFDGDEVVVLGRSGAAPIGSAADAGDARARGVLEQSVDQDGRHAVHAVRSRGVEGSASIYLLSVPTLVGLLVALAAPVPLYLNALVPFGLACLGDGRCTTWFHETSDAECQRAFVACVVQGRCAAEHGRCVARREVDCRHSLDCLDRGLCVLRGDACERVEDAPCAEPSCPTAANEVNLPCRELRAPRSYELHECGRRCTDTTMCRERGLCVTRGDECVATTEDCADSEACMERGLCSEKWSRCEASRVEDCAQSRMCTERGWCLPSRIENREDHYHAVCYLGGSHSVTSVPPP